jgi:hypothetical protein
MALFGEILAEFKAKEEEEPENITPLTEDASLRNGVVAWKSVSICFKESQECSCDNETSRWNWLWAQIEYDTTQFGKIAGVKTQDVSTLLTRLIGLRLIYPDGSINNFAKQYLQSIIMAKIKNVTRGRKPKEKSKEKPDGK